MSFASGFSAKELFISDPFHMGSGEGDYSFGLCVDCLPAAGQCHGKAENRVSKRVGGKTFKMKKIKLMILLALTSYMTTETRAQGDADVYDEAYARANLAYTDFMKLGISQTEYVRCVKVKNYLEPGITPKIVSIDGVEYKDDGKGYDTKEGDGILTAVKPTSYAKGAAVIGTGTYYVLPGNYFICDDLFKHGSSAAELILKIKINCEFEWVSCNTWPPEVRRYCFQFNWPFVGYLALKKCEFGVEF